MELKDFTTEELRAEIKRRTALEKEKREEEKRNALVCRNCKHCQAHKISNWTMGYNCMARMWGKKKPRHYTVSPSQKACEQFERKTD